MKASLTNSPWLDPKYDNAFRRDMNLADESSDLPGFEPKPAYVWLHKNGAEQHLYKALARLAPLFSARAHHKRASSWVALPPSGGGNRICPVVRKDAKQKVRSVGGNFSFSLETSPHPHMSAPPTFPPDPLSPNRGAQFGVTQNRCAVTKRSI